MQAGALLLGFWIEVLSAGSEPAEELSPSVIAIP
jgi:hypothetical protein